MADLIITTIFAVGVLGFAAALLAVGVALAEVVRSERQYRERTRARDAQGRSYP